MKTKTRLKSIEAQEKEKVCEERELSQKNSKSEIMTRRSFLKKSAYSAPVLIAMGELVKPDSAQAVNSVPAPPPLW